MMLREMTEIVGPLTEVGTTNHEVPAGEVVRCDCKECPDSWCGGQGPAYRRERKRHATESRWIGEWNVCTRCTKTPPIFEDIQYPDLDGVKRAAHVRWLVQGDVSIYENWDEDFNHYYPLCACSHPFYSHKESKFHEPVEAGCIFCNGEDSIGRGPKPICPQWRPIANQPSKGNGHGDNQRSNPNV